MKLITINVHYEDDDLTMNSRITSDKESKGSDVQIVDHDVMTKMLEVIGECIEVPDPGSSLTSQRGVVTKVVEPFNFMAKLRKIIGINNL